MGRIRRIENTLRRARRVDWAAVSAPYQQLASCARPSIADGGRARRATRGWYRRAQIMERARSRWLVAGTCAALSEVKAKRSHGMRIACGYGDGDVTSMQARPGQAGRRAMAPAPRCRNGRGLWTAGWRRGCSQGVRVLSGSKRSGQKSKGRAANVNHHVDLGASRN